VLSVLARFISKKPIAPQINTPKLKKTVSTQLLSQLLIMLNKQLNATAAAPYFARHFSSFEGLTLLKITQLHMRTSTMNIKAGKQGTP
jgi:hypothetical protein